MPDLSGLSSETRGHLPDAPVQTPLASQTHDSTCDRNRPHPLLLRLGDMGPLHQEEDMPQPVYHYELLNKDDVLASFRVDAVTEAVDDVRLATDRLPIGFSDVRSFLLSRKAPSNRSHIREILAACHANTLVGYLDVVHALSVTDTFWVRRVGSSLDWSKASIFANGFDHVVERIAFEGGLFGEEISSPSPEASLGGSFAKCVCRHNGRLSIMKAPMQRTTGESWGPWSEVMAFQVARALGLDCVSYEFHWHRSARDGSLVPTSVCPLFTSESVGFASARRWMGSSSLSYPELLRHYESLGAGHAFRGMVVLDALTLNTDRHMGNHGVLFDTDTLKPIGIAPIFDNNMSFMQGFSYDGSFDLIERARRSLTPAIGSDFNDVARLAMWPDLRRRVHGLTGFEFDRGALPGIPEQRVDAMAGIVRQQARALSGGGSQPFGIVREPDPALLWQLEDWPDDPACDDPLAIQRASATEGELPDCGHDAELMCPTGHEEPLK